MRAKVNKGALIICGLLILGGFVFPYLFLLAAIFGWMIIQDLMSPPIQEVPPPPLMPRLTVTAEEPEWKRLFLDFCESPAEEAFLESMISAYALLPDKGVLKGGHLSLNLQVEIKPYRVDFLANGWLVIEIDGAAYHSSPATVRNDRIRDQFLQDKDYSVIRIPAKVVFNDAAEAVRNVRSAIAGGRRPDSDSATKQTLPIPKWSLAQTLGSMSKSVSELDSYVTTASAVQQATSQSREIFNSEKIAINNSVEHVIREIKTEEFRSKSDEHRKFYDEAYDRYTKLLKEPGQKLTVSIPTITVPPPHPDPAIDEAIKKAHHYLMDERSNYFKEIRRRMKVEHCPPELVKARLHEIECSTCWDAIS